MFVKIFTYFLILISYVKSDCNLQNCNISEYKRCYPVYSLINATQNLECQCLRSLYALGDKCIGSNRLLRVLFKLGGENYIRYFTYKGVIRYDFNFVLFISPVLVQTDVVSSQIKTLAESIPTATQLASNIRMDVESTVYASSDIQGFTNAYSKLILWKSDQKNPTDLPLTTIDQMSAILKSYLTTHVTYNQGQNITQLGDILIGRGDNVALFLSSWSLQFNNWTCSTDLYTYCADHTQCKPNLGGVQCKCDPQISIDTSPQIDLFPGEQCNYTCDLGCWNGGTCLYHDSKPTCFCYQRYIGSHCEIDILLFSIIVLCILFVLCLLCALCGVCDHISKKRHEDKKSKLKSN